MANTIIVHLTNSDPIIGEVDQLPTSIDNMIIINNPRMKDGKDIPYLADNVSIAMWPMHRVSFIEVITQEGEEEIIGFVRE